MMTAVTSRRQDASLGKRVATLERLRISRFNRSTLLDVRIRRQWLGGKRKTVKPSGMFSSAQEASFGELSAYLFTS